MIQIETPDKAKSGISLFNLGFRPFFLLTALQSIWGIAIVLMMLTGIGPSEVNLLHLHQHEMVFGTMGAVITGFLLTAVPNWTGIQTPTGWRLQAMCLIWLVARILPWFNLPSMAAMVELTFYLSVMVGIAPALVSGKNKKNLVFLVYLAVLGLTACLDHLYPGLGFTLIALDIVVAVCLVVGGRVIPFFTERATGVNVKRQPKLQIGAIIMVIVLGTCHAIQWHTHVGAGFYLVTALVLFFSIQGWWVKAALKHSLLWSLYLAMGWLVVGLALRGLSYMDLVPAAMATHALAMGGVGGLVLSMMSRVSLGHTGRLLKPARPIVLAFIMLNTAVLVRLLAFIDVLHTMEWLFLSALLWVLAFMIFLVIYTPVLIAPRPDGQAG